MGASSSKFIMEIQQGAIVVTCSSQITKPDSDPLIIIINNYTTSDDLIDLVLARCKARCLDRSDFCVIMETRQKGGPVNTNVMGNMHRPLDMQVAIAKGQTRFTVQPVIGIVVKVYDLREWLMEPYGDIYLTHDYTTHQLLMHLTCHTNKKKISKLCLGLGNSLGKVYELLTDDTKPLCQYEQFIQTADPLETCLLIVKKVKASSKFMFRSLSWSSLTNSEPLNTKLDRKFKKSKKKRKDSKTYPGYTCGDDWSIKTDVSTEISIHSFPDQQAQIHLSANDKIHNSLVSSNQKIKKTSRKHQDNKSATCPRGRPPVHNLTTSFSCEDIFSTVLHEKNTLTESTPPEEDFVPEKTHTDAIHNNLNVVRSHSLGDISTNVNISLPVSLMDHRDYQNLTDMYDQRESISQVSDVSSNVTLRSVSQKIYLNKQARKSCIARMNCNDINSVYTEKYGGITENYTPKRQEYSAEFEGRMRRTLPQIPVSDIDMKKKRFAELMKRRLTICGGEIQDCDKLMAYHPEGQKSYPPLESVKYQHVRKFAVHGVSNTGNIAGNFVPVHEPVSATKSVPNYEGAYNNSGENLVHNVNEANIPDELGNRVMYENHFKPYRNDETNDQYETDASRTAVSPVKLSSDVGSDFGTNSESAFNSNSFNHVQPDYRTNRNPLSPPNYIPCQGHVSFSSNESEPTVTPACHSSPKSVTDASSPSLYQILSTFQVFGVQLKLIRDRAVDESLSLCETCLKLPILISESSENTTPKGHYAVGLGGPGSAFKRVKKDSKTFNKYSFVSIDWISSACLSPGIHHVAQRGDLLVEINGKPVLGLSAIDIISTLTNVTCPSVEMVIARRKLRDATQQLPTKKLRQQCSSEVTQRQRSTVSQDETDEALQLWMNSVDGRERERRQNGESRQNSWRVDSWCVNQECNSDYTNVRRYSDQVNCTESYRYHGDVTAKDANDYCRSLDTRHDRMRRNEPHGVYRPDESNMNGYSGDFYRAEMGVHTSRGRIGQSKNTESRSADVRHTVYQRNNPINAQASIKPTIETSSIAYSADEVTGEDGGSVHSETDPLEAHSVDVSSHCDNYVKTDPQNTNYEDFSQKTYYSDNIIRNGTCDSDASNAYCPSGQASNQAYNSPIKDPGRKHSVSQSQGSALPKNLLNAKTQPSSQKFDADDFVVDTLMENLVIDEHTENTRPHDNTRKFWNIKQVFKWKSNDEVKKQNASKKRMDGGCGVGRTHVSSTAYRDASNNSLLRNNSKQPSSMTTFHPNSNKTPKAVQNSQQTVQLSETQKNGNTGGSYDHNQNFTHNVYYGVSSNGQQENAHSVITLTKGETSGKTASHVNNVIRLYNCEMGEDEFIV